MNKSDRGKERRVNDRPSSSSSSFVVVSNISSATTTTTTNLSGLARDVTLNETNLCRLCELVQDYTVYANMCCRGDSGDPWLKEISPAGTTTTTSNEGLFRFIWDKAVQNHVASTFFCSARSDYPTTPLSISNLSTISLSQLSSLARSWWSSRRPDRRGIDSKGGCEGVLVRFLKDYLSTIAAMRASDPPPPFSIIKGGEDVAGIFSNRFTRASARDCASVRSRRRFGKIVRIYADRLEYMGDLSTFYPPPSSACVVVSNAIAKIRGGCEFDAKRIYFMKMGAPCSAVAASLGYVVDDVVEGNYGLGQSLLKDKYETLYCATPCGSSESTMLCVDKSLWLCAHSSWMRYLEPVLPKYKLAMKHLFFKTYDDVCDRTRRKNVLLTALDWITTPSRSDSGRKWERFMLREDDPCFDSHCFALFRILDKWTVSSSSTTIYDYSGLEEEVKKSFLHANKKENDLSFNFDFILGVARRQARSPSPMDDADFKNVVANTKSRGGSLLRAVRDMLAIKTSHSIQKDVAELVLALFDEGILKKDNHPIAYAVLENALRGDRVYVHDVEGNEEGVARFCKILLDRESLAKLDPEPEFGVRSFSEFILHRRHHHHPNFQKDYDDTAPTSTTTTTNNATTTTTATTVSISASETETNRSTLEPESLLRFDDGEKEEEEGDKDAREELDLFHLPTLALYFLASSPFAPAIVSMLLFVGLRTGQKQYYRGKKSAVKKLYVREEEEGGRSGGGYGGLILPSELALMKRRQRRQERGSVESIAGYSVYDNVGGAVEKDIFPAIPLSVDKKIRDGWKKDAKEMNKRNVVQKTLADAHQAAMCSGFLWKDANLICGGVVGEHTTLSTVADVFFFTLERLSLLSKERDASKRKKAISDFSYRRSKAEEIGGEIVLLGDDSGSKTSSSSSSSSSSLFVTEDPGDLRWNDKIIRSELSVLLYNSKRGDSSSPTTTTTLSEQDYLPYDMFYETMHHLRLLSLSPPRSLPAPSAKYPPLMELATLATKQPEAATTTSETPRGVGTFCVPSGSFLKRKLSQSAPKFVDQSPRLDFKKRRKDAG